jgi:GR25 family glycosyltransferase involved in LPS biosynthesis
MGWLLLLLLHASYVVECIAQELTCTVPHVLFVNMKRSTERRSYTETWLREDALLQAEQWTRVDAIDAHLLEIVDTQHQLSIHATLAARGSATSVLQARTWRFGLWGSTSTLGCGLSHAKAIAVAYSMGLQEALIIEDDIQMINLSDQVDNGQMVWHYLRQLVNSLPDNWDVLQVFNTIYSPRKAYEMHNQLMQHILWMRKDHCSSDDHLVLGAGAYLISRKGMHSFLSRHLPQFLHATQAEAESFGGFMDFRDSAISSVSDMWIYDLDNVYTSNLPLFIPADHVAQYSTIHSLKNGSTLAAFMPSEQLQALQVSLGTLRSAGMFTVTPSGSSSSSSVLKRALLKTREQFERSDQLRLSFGRPSKIVLMLELSLHGSTADRTGLETPFIVYDITRADQRLEMLLVLEQISPWQARFWKTMVNLFFSRSCSGVVKANTEHAPNASTNSEIVVLVPVYQHLRAFRLSQSAEQQSVDGNTVAVVAQRVCLSANHLGASCTYAIIQRLQLALDLYSTEAAAIL